MKITLPEGFPIPENVRPGEPFEVVATIAPGEDGGFTLTAIDGMKLSEEEEPEDEMEDEMEDEDETEGETPVTSYNDASGVQLPF
jgi:hypothetical protein